jgi:hypothetical protein
MQFEIPTSSTTSQRIIDVTVLPTNQCNTSLTVIFKGQLFVHYSKILLFGILFKVKEFKNTWYALFI